ncbi:integral membrane protein [Burkholderia pseudomallei Pakistan 9]|nr:integral membrane protein [Burkholderia pseudomallei Pakistan 9]
MNQPARSPAVAGMLNKVPEVTLAFWIVKIMSTTVGETGADYLAVHVGLGAAVTGALTACLLVGALALQWRARAYVPWIYWLNIVLVSVAGTQITDALTDGLGVSLHVSTPLFAAALAATFALWYRSERTLSIHTIVTPAPRGVLLGRDPADVRARHGGGRSRDRGARPRIPARDRRVRRRDRARRGGRARRDEPRARVLARVHPHAPARRVAR